MYCILSWRWRSWCVATFGVAVDRLLFAVTSLQDLACEWNTNMFLNQQLCLISLFVMPVSSFIKSLLFVDKTHPSLVWELYLTKQIGRIEQKTIGSSWKYGRKIELPSNRISVLNKLSLLLWYWMARACNLTRQAGAYISKDVIHNVLFIIYPFSCITLSVWKIDYSGLLWNTGITRISFQHF